jgi:hypothetical protein
MINHNQTPSDKSFQGLKHAISWHPQLFEKCLKCLIEETCRGFEIYALTDWVCTAPITPSFSFFGRNIIGQTVQAQIQFKCMRSYRDRVIGQLSPIGFMRSYRDRIILSPIGFMRSYRDRVIGQLSPIGFMRSYRDRTIFQIALACFQVARGRHV